MGEQLQAMATTQTLEEMAQLLVLEVMTTQLLEAMTTQLLEVMTTQLLDVMTTQLLEVMTTQLLEVIPKQLLEVMTTQLLAAKLQLQKIKELVGNVGAMLTTKELQVIAQQSKHNTLQTLVI